MTIIEALKTGKRFRRPTEWGPGEWIEPFPDTRNFDLTKEELMADNWEVEKTKVTKTVEVWANLYPHTVFTYPTYEEAALAGARAPTRIACVKLKGTYEMEE